ncbi:DEAD DEAH box helicase, putative [Babesia ovata]|uniref:DEAD DEAH box helicase, putative n=1 Tax=Babesia ovata TaxID=189622 RepID=A0A2H6KF51_9APIC|nr:DEAD DEAH box helicase, putative [Babesia ovata]GBE61630.1 DEAD DEAH box helicase, putative [Babesia ovata]
MSRGYFARSPTLADSTPWRTSARIAASRNCARLTCETDHAPENGLSAQHAPSLLPVEIVAASYCLITDKVVGVLVQRAEQAHYLLSGLALAKLVLQDADDLGLQLRVLDHMRPLLPRVVQEDLHDCPHHREVAHPSANEVHDLLFEQTVNHVLRVYAQHGAIRTRELGALHHVVYGGVHCRKRVVWVRSSRGDLHSRQTMTV